MHVKINIQSNNIAALNFVRFYQIYDYIGIEVRLRVPVITSSFKNMNDIFSLLKISLKLYSVYNTYHNHHYYNLIIEFYISSSDSVMSVYCFAFFYMLVCCTDQ